MPWFELARGGVPDGLMFHGGTTMPDPKPLGETRRHFPRIAAINELNPSCRAACAAVANERPVRGTLGHVRFWPKRPVANGCVRTLCDGRECPVLVGPLEQPLHIFGGAQRYALLGEFADHDVVTIWIPERKLFCSCGGVHMRLHVESGYKSAGSLQCRVEVIDTEEQE